MQQAGDSSAGDGLADATALGQAVREGRTTASALMRDSLDRARNDKLGAITFLDEEMGLSAAATFDRLMADGAADTNTMPFAGVPFLVKGLGNAAKGLPAHAGSKAIAARVGKPERDSMIFERFRRAGLLPFGVTSCPSFGLSVTSEPTEDPVARNPWNPEYSPGGSSSGAAAAVASGIVAIAHATDAAGSIRIPAACCGLPALKPSRGLVPNAPEFSNHLMGITGELVIARSVRDISAALFAVSGHVKGPYGDQSLTGGPVRGLRIALVDTAPAGLGEEQANAIRSAEPILASHGHTIVDIETAKLDSIVERTDAIARMYLSISEANWIDSLGIGDEELHPAVADNAAQGRKRTAAELFRANTEAARLAHECWRIFENVDVIAMPVLGRAPVKIGQTAETHADADRTWAFMGRYAPRATLANVCGLPAMVIPRGLDHQGLPLSLQLIGPIGSDLLLLHIAHQLEDDAPWPFLSPIAGGLN